MGTMSFIAGWFLLLSILIGVATKLWFNRAWIGALFTLAASFVVIWIFFSLSFWPWVLLYLFLSWLGSWAVWMARNRKSQKQDSKA